MPDPKSFAARFVAWGRLRFSPEVFTRAAMVFAAAWFFGIFPLLNLLIPHRLPRNISASDCDFGQYYIGAAVAKYGIWDALYPLAKPEVYRKPPLFRPRYRTFLFHEKEMMGKAWFYPAVNLREASDFSPALLDRVPELKDHFSFRYAFPPPLGLLLRPLACATYSNARDHVWPILAMASLFGLAFFSSRIFRLLHGKPSYVEGAILLAITFFSVRGRTAVPDGNVTPILGFLIAYAVYGWMKGWQKGVGLAMIPLLLFKSMGLTWCPLLMLRQVRWGTIGMLAALTIALNGATVWIAGPEVYRQFFGEVLPKLAVPTGDGIVAVLFQSYGIYPAKLFFALQLLLFGFLCVGYWKGLGTTNETGRHAAIAATLAGTMAIFCLLNFSVWRTHYFPAYLCLPFLGWVLWEASLLSGRWRRILLAGAGVSFLFCSCDVPMRAAFRMLAGMEGADFYSEGISQPVYALLGPLFYLAVAFWRLFWAPSTVSKRAEQAPGILSWN